MREHFYRKLTLKKGKQMTNEKKDLYVNQYGQVYTAMLRTPVGRAAFTKLITPDIYQGQPKYRTCILFPKDNPEVVNSLKRLETAAEEALKKKFGDKLDKQRVALNAALRDGDDAKMAEYKGFKGCWYIQPGTKQIPTIVDEKESAIGAEAIISGMKVRAVVTGIITDKGVGWRLDILQLVLDDGVRYLGGPDPRRLLSMDEEDSDGSESASKTLAEHASDVL